MHSSRKNIIQGINYLDALSILRPKDFTIAHQFDFPTIVLMGDVHLDIDVMEENKMTDKRMILPEDFIAYLDSSCGKNGCSMELYHESFLDVDDREKTGKIIDLIKAKNVLKRDLTTFKNCFSRIGKSELPNTQCHFADPRMFSRKRTKQYKQYIETHLHDLIKFLNDMMEKGRHVSMANMSAEEMAREIAKFNSIMAKLQETLNGRSAESDSSLFPDNVFESAFIGAMMGTDKKEKKELTTFVIWMMEYVLKMLSLEELIVRQIDEEKLDARRVFNEMDGIFTDYFAEEDISLVYKEFSRMSDLMWLGSSMAWKQDGESVRKEKEKKIREQRERAKDAPRKKNKKEEKKEQFTLVQIGDEIRIVDDKELRELMKTASSIFVHRKGNDAIVEIIPHQQKGGMLKDWVSLYDDTSPELREKLSETDQINYDMAYLQIFYTEACVHEEFGGDTKLYIHHISVLKDWVGHLIRKIQSPTQKIPIESERLEAWLDGTDDGLNKKLLFTTLLHTTAFFLDLYTLYRIFKHVQSGTTPRTQNSSRVVVIHAGARHTDAISYYLTELYRIYDVVFENKTLPEKMFVELRTDDDEVFDWDKFIRVEMEIKNRFMPVGKYDKARMKRLDEEYERGEYRELESIVREIHQMRCGLNKKEERGCGVMG